MSENKTSRYFKYAIGEIILVVIGILIALQINNNNESRKAQRLESQYLNELQLDLEKDATDIAILLERSNTQLRSKTLLLQYLDKNSDYEMHSGYSAKYQSYDYSATTVQDSLIHYFNNQWSLGYNFAPHSTTIDELKSTGNLRVISNRGIRRAILEVYNAYEKYKLNHESIFKNQQEKLWNVIFMKTPIYHLTNEDVPRLFKDQEIQNRFEGNYVSGLNDGLLELQLANQKILDSLRKHLKAYD